MPEWQPATVIALVVLIAANYPLYRLIGRWFFAEWAEFSQASILWFTTAAWSFLRGEFWEDFMAEAKLAAYLVCCALIVGLEFLLVSPLIAGFIE